MFLIGAFVLALVVVLAFVASRRTTDDRGSRDRSETERRAERRVHALVGAGEAGPIEVVDLDEALERWVGHGVIDAEQAALIRAEERAAEVAHPAVVPRREGTRRPGTMPVAEALGYLGGILAGTGLALLVLRYWPDIAMAGRLALSGGLSLVAVWAGATMTDAQEGPRARLRGFLWLVGSAAAGLFAGVVAVDGLDVGSVAGIAVAVAGAVAVLSGLLWWWRHGVLQQIAALAAAMTATGALVALVAGQLLVGLAVWVVAVGLLVVGLTRTTTEPTPTIVLGALGAVVGSAITISGSQSFGLLFALGTAAGLVLLTALPDLVERGASSIVLLGMGAAAMLQFTPPTLVHFARDAGIVTGVATWAVGVSLLWAGTQRWLRQPTIVELVGAVVALGGAALTGAQAPGFAALFGIVTSVGLIGLGVLPGHVLLTVPGSLGLLVNVPWAIVWFFPGEGRAPLLILVSGVLIIGVAVLLARLAGRFRQLGSRTQE